MIEERKWGNGLSLKKKEKANKNFHSKNHYKNVF